MVKELSFEAMEEVNGGDVFGDIGKAVTGVVKAVGSAVVNTAAAVVTAVGGAIKAVGEGIATAVGGRTREYYPNGQVKSSSCTGLTCYNGK